ncbi:IclR family transcriptional regulator [Alicyclobacillus contaminans]|uniref:IclR family transcriptional regulator n=1 Tax=Alicyclobacillus contaminans TaxID=392016 RepID=UPI000413FB17|nr:IclR family transcriptional regulator [Alicyclobacillus contaminans]GMA49827.1 IclR family transcriptional regulator [Alicyclobacillus contaminans]
MEYHVPSVALAMRVLKLLSRFKYRRCSLKEISDLLQANPTTCLRVLRTLAREDFVRFHPETKKYSLGPYLIPLGNRAMELNDAVALFLSELRRVANATEFTTVLIERLQDNHLIYIGSEEAPNDDVKISVSIGQQFSIGSVAFGRCFLAYDDEAAWRKLADDGLLREVQSPDDLEKLASRLQTIRNQGYEVSHGDFTPGISSFSAPIFDKKGNVEFVLACLAVTSQVTPSQAERAVNVLVETTRRLSEWNGWQAARRAIPDASENP